MSIRADRDPHHIAQAETPRSEPEILPPHSSHNQERAEAFVFMSGPEVMRFRIRPISPLWMFVISLAAFAIIFLIATLFAGAFLIGLPIIAGLVLIGFAASLFRSLFR